MFSKVVLFDVNTRKIVGTMNVNVAASQGAKGRIRQVIWSANGQHVALLSKHYVCLATNTLVHLTSLHECIRVKSGVWDEHSKTECLREKEKCGFNQMGSFTRQCRTSSFC